MIVCVNLCEGFRVDVGARTYDEMFKVLSEK